jgi:WhiB family transcriptional regulator, redox-sensing transcriptional regulator
MSAGRDRGRICAQGRAGRGTADGPPAADGPVGPRRRTAGLPVKGAALRSASLRDGLAAALDREPRRPCTGAPSAAGELRPAAPSGTGRPALTRPAPGRQPVTDTQYAGRGWRDRAACRDVDVDAELFFPTAEAGPARDAQVAAAKAVCARCPVRAECLTEALLRIPHGIAGGLTEHERRRLRRDHPRTGAAVRVVDEVLADGPPPGMTRGSGPGSGGCCSPPAGPPGRSPATAGSAPAPPSAGPPPARPAPARPARTA